MQVFERDTVGVCTCRLRGSTGGCRQFLYSLGNLTIFNWKVKKRVIVIDFNLQSSFCSTLSLSYTHNVQDSSDRFHLSSDVRSVVSSVTTYKQSFPCLMALSETGLPQDVYLLTIAQQYKHTLVQSGKSWSLLTYSGYDFDARVTVFPILKPSQS